MKVKNPVILIIMDGWGLRRSSKCNAVKLGRTPNVDKFWRKNPHTILKAHGKDVGLPSGFQGNSEVGHLNIGAGRVVYEMIKIINDKIKNGSFFKDRELVAAMRNCVRNDSVLHIMGLVQDEGVHAHLNHCIALLRMAKMYKVKKVLVHVFSDGRDTMPRSAMEYVREVQKAMKKYCGKFATVVGRYYAMDRNNRWERIKKAYDLIADGKGEKVKNVQEAIMKGYSKGYGDEFIKPKVIGDYSGINANDSVVFFNYRLDRARQLTHAFVDERFNKFKRKKKKLTFVCFTHYYDKIPALIAFHETKMKNILGAVLSKKGFKQLRIAETEKYAHVTFFFNGEIEKPFKNEDRVIIPSPNVATYDLKPEMSAFIVKKNLLDAIRKKKYDVIIVNFANGDMVGHTGKLKAAIKAVETVDRCVGEVVNEMLKHNGVALVTADHGNCEEECGIHQTSHTLNPVPFIVVGKECRLRKKGRLADIAPTILDILKIKKPKEMTGRSLLAGK